MSEKVGDNINYLADVFYLNKLESMKEGPGPNMTYAELMRLQPLWEADPVSSAYKDPLMEETPVLQPEVMDLYKPATLTQRIQLLTGKPIADYSPSHAAYQHRY